MDNMGFFFWIPWGFFYGLHGGLFFMDTMGVFLWITWLFLMDDMGLFLMDNVGVLLWMTWGIFLWKMWGFLWITWGFFMERALPRRSFLCLSPAAVSHAHTSNPEARDWSGGKETS